MCHFQSILRKRHKSFIYALLPTNTKRPSRLGFFKKSISLSEFSLNQFNHETFIDDTFCILFSVLLLQ